MAEHIFPKQSNYGWGLTFNMTGKAPIVSKRIFATLADAQKFVDDVNDSAIEGLILSVIADDDNNGAYFVESIGNGSTAGKLNKIGSDSSGDITSIKSDITTLQGNVTTLQSDVAELQKIDHTTFIKGIKVNGSELTPTDQVVDITIDIPIYDTVISEDTKESTNAPQTKAVYDYVTDFVNTVKTTLETKISAVENFKFQVVNSYDELPKTEISLSTIYLVKNGTESGNNIYTEYLYVNDKWEILGELKFDPTELETKVTTLETKVTTLETTLNGKISDLDTRLTGLIDGLTTRLDTAEGNITKNTEDITDIKGRLDTVETNVGDLTTKIDGDGGDTPGLITNVTNLTTEVTNIKGKIDEITSTGGEPNVIETIQLNGTSITPKDKTVNILAVTSVVAKDFAGNEDAMTITNGKLVIESLTSTDIDKAIDPTQA